MLSAGLALSAERRRFDSGFAHWSELAVACLMVGGLIGDVSGFNGPTVDPLPWYIAGVVLLTRLFSFAIPALADIAITFIAAVVMGVILWFQASHLTANQELSSGWFMDLLACAGFLLSVALRLILRSRRGLTVRLAESLVVTAVIIGALTVTWSAASRVNAACCVPAPASHTHR